MKLYKVTAKNYEYDEYDSFIIWANTPKEALGLAIKTGESTYKACGVESNFVKGATIKECIKPGEPKILLGSFNAG